MSPRIHRQDARAFAAVCLCLVAFAARGEAAPQDLAGPPLKLSDALRRAIASNPGLQGFVYKLRAQDGRAQTAALKPQLQLTADVENLLGNGLYRGAESVEATLTLSRLVELGGKRERRMQAANAGRSLIEVERSAAQLDALAEVTRRLLHVASDQEQGALTQRATALARDTVKAAEQRTAAAKAPEAEVRRARAALARAQLEEEHAEHELLTSRQKLAASWGADTPDFGRVDADLYALPALPDLLALSTAIDTSPDLLRFANTARLRDAELRLAEARSRADLTLSVGIRRLEQTQDQALVFGATLPLFASARAAGAIAEARAERELTETEQAAHRLNLRTQLFELYQELKHSLTEAATLRDQVLPEMESALKETDYAFRRGRYGYVELVAAQREVLDAQRALITASFNAHLFQTEIERLTGQALETALETTP